MKYSQLDKALYIVKGFIAITGFSDEQFVNYMTKNNLWYKLDDKKLLFSPWMEAEHYLNVLGDGLTKEEKDCILANYYSVMQYK